MSDERAPGAPILTEEQAGRLWEAIETWKRVYREEKSKPVDFTEVNVRKSCLLGRLIFEGKPPLPVPPPRFLSAPWYDLIENGRSHLWREFGVWTDGNRVVIGQDDGWELLETRDGGAMLLAYPRNGRWLLRDVRPDEPPVLGGQTIEDEEGGRMDHARPVYYDTVLERYDTTLEPLG